MFCVQTVQKKHTQKNNKTNMQTKKDDMLYHRGWNEAFLQHSSIFFFHFIFFCHFILKNTKHTIQKTVMTGFSSPGMHEMGFSSMHSLEPLYPPRIFLFSLCFCLFFFFMFGERLVIHIGNTQTHTNINPTQGNHRITIFFF